MNSRVTRGTTAAGIAGAILLLAGCGSTVAGAGAQQANGNSSNLSAPTQQLGGTSAPAVGSTGAAGAAGSSGGAQAGGAGSGSAGFGSTGSAGGGSATTNGLVPADAPGITASTIYIGIGYSSSANAGDAAIGAAGAGATYDARNVTDAAFAYANAHGGFAGRRLKAIYYDYNLTDDRSAQDASACASYTQDNKVFAIYTDTDELRACAEHAHALALSMGAAETSDTFKKYPHYIDAAGMAFDRSGNVTVEGLFQQHYFTGKLGLVTWDDPTYRRAVQTGYLPAMARHGISLATDVVYIPVSQNANDISGSSAAISNAVTKFKTLGVDHVIIQDGAAGVWKGDGLTFEFQQQAKSQSYKPRYGGNTSIQAGGSINPSDQEDTELEVSDSDLEAADDAGWHLNAAREKCFKIEADAGYPVKPGNGNDEAQAALDCDTAFFLQRLINSLGVITVDNVLAAANGLGTSFSSALVYGTNLFPGRRDGSDYVRVLEYFASCSCTKYKNAPYRVG